MTLREMTIYVSTKREDKHNTSYPYEVKISSLEDLKKAVEFDHVCGKHSDGKNTRGRMIQAYRNDKTFLEADCLPMDCDNTQKNPMLPDLTPEQWKTPDDVRAAFPDVAFFIVYSRNNMKVKNGFPARPKFHIYFFMDTCSNAQEYQKLKQEIQQYFPAFDSEALGASRFLFGVENPTVEYFEGTLTINEFMERQKNLPAEIPEGQRNGTLSRFAGTVFKKYGDTEKAADMVCEANEQRCNPPLASDEVDSIIRSARHFLHNTVEKDPSYIPPEQFAAQEFAEDGKKIKVTSKTIKEILKKLNISIRLNVISGMVEIEGMPEKFSKENAANVLPVLLKDYLTEHDISCSLQNINDYLVLVEDENRFNPVKDMLRATKYDGEDRLSEIPKILGIENNERECRYLYKWMHQCVAMALNSADAPYGADGVLVLQCEQGAGKTLFCSTMAMNPDWFAEGLSIDLNNKDSIIQATSCWIAELGELDSTLKREQSALKAFLTSKTDTYRQPYARVQTKKLRRTSFCATVNPKEFLNDETGSRRYWVIHPQNIDCERLTKLSKEWLMQLWRQVYDQLFRPNPQGFRLNAEERAELQRENEQYSKPLPGETELLDLLAWESPLSKWNWYRTSTIKEELHLSIYLGQLGKALTKLSSYDSRIQVKAPNNCKQYFLPPMRRQCFAYRAEEDFDLPLLGNTHQSA